MRLPSPFCDRVASASAFDWQLASYDYCTALKDVDAIADVPVPQVTPFIYAAHADARVIITVREAAEWYPRRINWMAPSR